MVKEKSMTNKIIREELEKMHLFNYQAARRLNVSESTWTRMMREDLPEIEQHRIIDLIRSTEEGS